MSDQWYDEDSWQWVGNDIGGYDPLLPVGVCDPVFHCEHLGQKEIATDAMTIKVSTELLKPLIQASLL
jgi:hypothetical protein